MNACNGGCNKPLKANEKISCSQTNCKKQFHYFCVQLASAKKPTNWKCPDCIQEMSSNQRNKIKNYTPVKNSLSKDINESLNERQNVTITRGNTLNNSFVEETVNLRSAVRNILHEEIRDIIRAAISEEFSILRKELRSCEDSLSYLNNKFEEMKNNVEACVEMNKTIQLENNLLQRKVKYLESRLSVIEQGSRQNNIEIHCLPEHRQENLVNTLMQISKVVSFPLTETDIVACNRVQKQNPASKVPKTVICRFVSKLKRDNLLAFVRKDDEHPAKVILHQFTLKSLN
ncbi:unnamed protein product [Parnassius mnemosyne]|uniref:Zinc finger PHD-type domain-containing protein n=1 Tax=Parnassius mnemosyne TaxID=213953 RepID=A0AAV1LIE6_9NEOP